MLKRDGAVWWDTEGVYELDAIVSEYGNEDLGHVPLGNIFQFPDDIKVDVALINRMRRDGADIGVDDEGDLYINIR